MSDVLVCSGGCGILAVGNTGSTITQRHWAQVNGSPTIVSDAFGTWFRFTANATYPFLSRNATGLSQTYIRMRGRFRVSDATPSADMDIAYFDCASGTSPRLRITTGGVLQMAGGATANGPTLADNTIYAVEMECDVHANPTVVKWRTRDVTNGGSWTDQTNYSHAQAATTIPDWQFGIVSTGPTSSEVLDWQHMIVGEGTSSTDYLATGEDLYVGRLLPTADGTHSFTAGDFGYDGAAGDVATNATNVWDYLNDADQTTTVEWIRQKVIRPTGYLEVSLADPPANQVPLTVAITATLHSSGTSANTASIKASDDGFSSTTTVLSLDDVSDTTLHYRHLPMTSKPSGGAWTNAALSALLLRIGYSTDVTDVPYWDSLSAEYSYRVTASGSLVIGGSFFP